MLIYMLIVITNEVKEEVYQQGGTSLRGTVEK